MTGASTAADQAYRRLRDAIAAGEYTAGFPLREEALAEITGVSRTPIREALRRLDAEGLVELLPNRGARVATWGVHDVDEIFQLRVLVEGYGARLAANRATEARLAELAALCDEMEAEIARRNIRAEQVAEINARFHRGVLAAAGSRRLETMAAGVVQRTLTLRTFHLYSPEQLTRSCAHHRELLDAIAARDGKWAEAIMRAHLHAGQHTARTAR